MTSRNRTRRRVYDDTQTTGAFVRCAPEEDGTPCACSNCVMQTAPEEGTQVETQVRRKCDGGDHKLVKHPTHGEYRVCAYGCGLYYRVK